MMHAIVDVVDTPHGPFTMLADDDGAVLGAGWNTTVDDVVARVHVQLRPSGVTAGRVHAAEAVRAYYGGDIAAPGRVQVRQHGTDLQNAGWQRLRDVAPGQTKTYAEFADELGQDPGAVRAVAAVCARNAVALFVPCHRVLRADGSLGGFAWGREVKRALLAHENAPGFVSLF